jgi:hypothetical protein
MEDIDGAIKENDILVFVIENKAYADSLTKISRAVAAAYKKTCYVSLNKPYEVVARELEKNKIDPKKFFFIDCTGNVSDSENVMHVSSPRALTELNLAISKVLDRVDVKSCLFDSLSTLLIYENPSIVIKFAHSIISAFRSKGTKVVFVCLKENMKSELIGDLSMFADKVMEL